ncbi:MAG: DinB family protein [Planctomycetota bacterium]
MAIKSNIVYSLTFSRQMLNGIVETLNSTDEWLAQACPKANHPLWVIGHLALADNMFAARIQGQEPEVPEGWNELFWFGSEVYSDPSKYPPVDEVLAYFHERRENLMKIVEETDESVFLGPPPSEGMFAEAPNMGALLLFTSFHEGIHAGQATVAHRSLGREPMMKPQPAAS